MSDKIVVGVDIGGTAIKVGVCNLEGQLLHTYEGPTGNEHGESVICDNIAAYARLVVEQAKLSWHDVQGVGVGVPGFLDIPNGIVKFSANLDFRDTPLKAILEDKLQKKVLVNNDANVAALGEAWGGAGKGIDQCVCFTLGTGVGGGIIIGGKVIEGFNGLAGELGHMNLVPDAEAIECGCGKTGCLETVSSATGIIRMANDAVRNGESTTLSVVEDITAKEVVDAAKAGDEVAKRIVARAALYLGKALGQIAVVLNPERIIIGGGVSKAGDFLFDQVREVFEQSAPKALVEGVSVVPAVLGNNAGVVGAAGLIIRS